MTGRREYSLIVQVDDHHDWWQHRISPVREAIRQRGVILDSYSTSKLDRPPMNGHRFHVAATPEEMTGILSRLQAVLGETVCYEDVGRAPRLRWWKLRETRFHWRPRLDRQDNGTLDVSWLWWTWYNEPETREEIDESNS